MGVTRLETDRAVVYFDHEEHSRRFTPEVEPDKIDAFITIKPSEQNLSRRDFLGGGRRWRA
jgi:hypothetical protein